ncbi:unnamed protein product [Prorocentrum cordatum]|uniref:RING-type domain-containing protein n=1 Tax=Prorocentrum cordatum TaxID=2364126 RepID=A0ABN9YH46_9DINO|nr:unnamed protein product [Polarella glacialis]
MRAHRVKFRSAFADGEFGSSWLCIRRTRREDGSLAWAGHGAVIRARFKDDEADLTFADEDDKWLDMGQRAISVKFRLLPGSSDPAPKPGFFAVETIPKALAESCMAASLSQLPEAPLARALVLGARDGLPQPPAGSAEAELTAWALNPSQLRAVRYALAQPFTLVQGPPGTGKTRTTAVLATLLARRNSESGLSRAVLFCAPTNRAADCAALFVARLLAERAHTQLTERLGEDGQVCAVCLLAGPDVVTACGHVFHRGCLTQALQVSDKCPICRRQVKHADSGLRILRIYGADAEKAEFPVPRRNEHPNVDVRKQVVVPEEMRRFTLHWRCHAAVEGETSTKEAMNTRRAYRAMIEHGPRGPRSGALRAAYQLALADARAAELRDADIVFTTCVSCRRMAVSEALQRCGGLQFEQVILDEAGQATEPESLCPLTFAACAQQACLFGDHLQLRPILKSHTAKVAGLGVSLFERLASAGGAGGDEGPLCFLAQQYRMHPEISRFPSQHFYSSRLLDDDSVLARPRGLLQHPRGEPAALLLVDSGEPGAGEEVRPVRTAESSAYSRLHAGEAARAAELAVALTARAGPGSVAVLSWYNAQVQAVVELLGEGSGVHAGSIATAQGSEWDYVLLSAVRHGGPRGQLGIVSDENVLNVALTLTRLGLVVYGNRRTLSQDPNWAAFLRVCAERGLVLSEQPLVTQEEAVLEAAWSRAMRPGLKVTVSGLTGAAELNGQTATVLEPVGENGRCKVEVARGAGPPRLLLVRPRNLELPRERPAAPGAGAGAGAARDRRHHGLSALVSASRPSGGVAFMQTVHLEAANLEVLGQGASLRRGARVRVHGLTQARAVHNGGLGTVISPAPSPGGTWEVEVSKHFRMGGGSLDAKLGERGLEVRPQEASPPLHEGLCVMLHGLRAQAEYNGEWARVLSCGADGEGRWQVEFTFRGEVTRLELAPENMAPEVPS